MVQGLGGALRASPRALETHATPPGWGHNTSASVSLITTTLVPLINQAPKGYSLSATRGAVFLYLDVPRSAMLIVK